MNTNTVISFSLLRRLGIVIGLAVFFSLVACGGTQEKKDQPAEATAEEPKGKLSQTFTIVDEQGRKSGTLTVDFHGGAVLRNESGDIIGKFKPEAASEAKPEEAPSEAQPAEAASEAQPAEAGSEVKPEEAPSEAQPAGPTTE